MLLCYCGTAFGWGKSGHDAIAYIAECNLTPKAKKNIEKYLDGRSIVYYAVDGCVPPYAGLQGDLGLARR